MSFPGLANFYSSKPAQENYFLTLTPFPPNQQLTLYFFTFKVLTSFFLSLPWGQLMLCGMQELDVDEWEKYTIYRNYTRNSKQIQWFWQVCTSCTSDMCVYNIIYTHMYACSIAPPIFNDTLCYVCVCVCVFVCVCVSKRLLGSLTMKREFACSSLLQGHVVCLSVALLNS